MKTGDRVRIRGAKQEGVVVSTRLVPAALTDRGKSGKVLFVTVDFGGTTIEYEHLELKLVT